MGIPDLVKSAGVLISNTLREKVEAVHGEFGRKWLHGLPALIEESRRRWSLELDQPFANLSYNLVVPGRMPNGAHIVLKLGVPCRELFSEAEALRCFDGKGAVRLIDHDARNGRLLLERVVPGTPLHKSLPDPEASVVAARVIRGLKRSTPANNDFVKLTDWFLAFERLRKRYGGSTGPLPDPLITAAEETFLQLNAAERDVLLHGDLHHENILFSNERGWLAIDPKGVVGDLAYEVGSFMINQLEPSQPGSVTKEIMNQRLTVFAGELGIEKRRLARWAFFHAILSAVWDVEEGADRTNTIRFAEILKQLSRD